MVKYTQNFNLSFFFLAALGLRCCTWAFWLSLVAASGGYTSLRCVGFSLWWLLLLWSTGSRRAGSVVVALRLQSAGSVVVVHRLSCSTACGIFPGQGSNPCPLHWQVDSLPLCHQGSSSIIFKCIKYIHIVVQPSPSSSPELYSFCKTETLSPLNTNFSVPLPQPLAPTMLLSVSTNLTTLTT